MQIAGLYKIDNGTYSFTLKSLFNRQFKLNSGSTISFNGPFSETTLDVDAMFAAKARLADLLTDADKNLYAALRSYRRTNPPMGGCEAQYERAR